MSLRTWPAAVLCLVLTCTCALASKTPDYRHLAASTAAKGDHAGAAHLYRLTAVHYREVGDVQAGIIFDRLADQWEPVLVAYRDRKASAAELKRFSTGQKGEPLYGCYLGVNCFRDPNVNGFDDFCRLTGKQHAIFYEYARHGVEDWGRTQMMRLDGPWYQAACEMRGSLAEVTADAGAEAWAKKLGQAPGHIFLRWGSEMNGSWVRWNGNPALYIQKFRLVHDLMARFAPNVAMVWCPNATPAPKIAPYYPGDAYVDWVGVNSYVVSIHNNRPSEPAQYENPADLFKDVYQRYSARKPIMICETGVTHRSAALGTDQVDFAAARIGHLYGSLPRVYPRLKAICYYDVNNLAGAANGREFNNYLLTDSPKVLGAYRRSIAPDYFLSGRQQPGGPFPAYIERVANGQTLKGKVHLTAWAKGHSLNPAVTYKLDGKKIGSSRAAGTYDCQLDCAKVAPGPHTLSLTLQTERGKTIKQVSYRVKTVR
jgi:hypothetical protein